MAWVFGGCAFLVLAGLVMQAVLSKSAVKRDGAAGASAA
jgi:hypothetical protein